MGIGSGCNNSIICPAVGPDERASLQRRMHRHHVLPAVQGAWTGTRAARLRPGLSPVGAGLTHKHETGDIFVLQGDKSRRHAPHAGGVAIGGVVALFSPPVRHYPVPETLVICARFITGSPPDDSAPEQISAFPEVSER